jgi:TetR/AcrR family transcriptional regulator, transcriptional repressor of bet genes
MTVDHNARRQRIAEVTAEVIAREGLDAATIRRISAELGGPTKIITYYFSDKQELLRFTWEHMAELYYQKVTHEPADIIDSLLAMTTADEKSILRWRVYVAFWDRATRDPEFAELQRSHMDMTLQLLGNIVRSLDPDRGDVERVSLLLNALVQGISLQSLVDPQRWPAERIRAALMEQVALLLPKAPLP